MACGEEYTELIEIVGLRKSFGGKEVLKGIDLYIEKGKTTVILGPSGSGKTLLLRHIIGLMKPDSGKVLLDGVNIFEMSEKELKRVRRRFGMVFQMGALFDSLNVFENVAFGLRRFTKLTKGEIEGKVSGMLELVGLGGTEELYPDELSGGMRKRVAIARALAFEPDIVLFDEPTTGLDPISAANMDKIIYDVVNSTGVTAVVVTHDLESAAFISNKVAMIYEGRIVQVGTMADIISSENPVVRRFVEAREGYS